MAELDLELWLKADDFENDEEVEFTDAGEKTEIPTPNGEENKEGFEIGIKLPNGESRKWTMNKTSQRAVAQKYGVLTDRWVGKKVKLFKADQNVRGEMKQVIYARVPE